MITESRELSENSRIILDGSNLGSSQSEEEEKTNRTAISIRFHIKNASVKSCC